MTSTRRGIATLFVGLPGKYVETSRSPASMAARLDFLLDTDVRVAGLSARRARARRVP